MLVLASVLSSLFIGVRFLKGGVPIGLEGDEGDFAALVGVVFRLVLFPVGFDFFFAWLLVDLVAGGLEADLLGGDALLFVSEELASDDAINGGASADHVGKVLRGEEVADVFVESAGSDAE